MPAVQTTPHIVLFADLLGFRDRALKVARDKKAASLLLTDYSSAIDLAMAAIEEFRDGAIFRSFGDSFLFAERIAGQEAESEMGWVLIAACDVQLALANAGWFMRGGLAVGPFVADDRLVFGQAFFEAYALEQEKAIHPRIVLSEGAAQEAESHMRFYGKPYEAPHNGYLLRDADGSLFLNYLYAPLGAGEDPSVAAQLCGQHKVVVEKALDDHRGSPRHWAKYEWIARYHNFFVDKWLPRQAPQLRIANEAVAPFPELFMAKP